MRRINTRSVEQSHPLFGFPCPVTKLEAFVDKEWCVDRPDYRLRSGILEKGVVLSLPIGYTRIWDTDTFFRNLKKIRENPRLDRRNFVLIEDYGLHAGSDYEGRLEYIQRMVNEIKPTGIIFFNVSASWKLNIRLGLVIGRNTFPVRIAHSYEHALRIASEILKRPLPGIDLENSEIPSEWKTSTYHVKCVPHSNAILQFQYLGVPQKQDVLQTLKLYENQLNEAQESLEGNSAIIHDVSALTRIPLSSLRTFLVGIFMRTRHLRSRRIIVVHPNLALRAVLLGIRPFSHGRLNCSATLAEALALATEPIPLTQDDIVRSSMKIIESMEWEIPGFQLQQSFPSNSPYHYLVSSLAILKQDVDYYLEDRENELVELENGSKKAIELTAKLQESLERSEEDRKRLKDLAIKNVALTLDIEQSQKEILLVLSDFVDQRSGESQSHSRRISRIVGRIALDLGWPETHASNLHDAGLLHDVGFLGIPDTVATERATSPEAARLYQEHCNIGHEVLCKIKGDIMQTAAIVTQTHHEHWDGSGYPNGLKTDEIPMAGRILTAAEHLVRFWDEGVHDENLLKEKLQEKSGHELDPAIVVILMEHAHSYMDLAHP